MMSDQMIAGGMVGIVMAFILALFIALVKKNIDEVKAKGESR